MNKCESIEIFKEKVLELKQEKKEIEKLASEKEELEQNEIIKIIKRYMDVSKKIDDYKENKNFSNMEDIINYVYFENQSSIKTPNLYVYIGDWDGGYLAHEYARYVPHHYVGMNNENAACSVYGEIGRYWVPDYPLNCPGFVVTYSKLFGDKEKFEEGHNIICIETDDFLESQRNFLKLRAEFFEYLIEEDEEKATAKMMEKYGNGIIKVRSK